MTTSKTGISTILSLYNQLLIFVNDNYLSVSVIIPHSFRRALIAGVVVVVHSKGRMDGADIECDSLKTKIIK